VSGIEIDINLDEWLQNIEVELERADRAMVQACFKAAKDGVAAAQEKHPYTDRTGNLTDTAHARIANMGDHDAEMRWPMHYAGYVDEGTSRNRPYPFTPRAIRVCDRSLKKYVREVLVELARQLK
jgi:hypothetical protein